MSSLVANSSNWRRTVVLLSFAGLSIYGAYKLHRRPSVDRSRRTIASVLAALASVPDAVSSTADTVSLLSHDLHSFLSSDSDRIPTSIKQVAKLVQADDFVASISRTSGAVASGIIRGVNGTKTTNGVGFYDRVVDKILSDVGTEVVSVAAGSFGRGLVEGLHSGGISNSQTVPWWVDLICEDKLRPVIRECIQTFVGTAVGVYLEKTMDINTYDEIFAGLTSPAHEAKMKDMLISVCNASVETLVRTSHQVLAGSDSVLGRTDVVRSNVQLEQDKDISSSDQCSGNSGSHGEMLSTLASPNHQRFVPDLVGWMTFEIARSFLEISMQKLYVKGRRSMDVVRRPIVERGKEVLLYVNVKSMLIFAICVAVCLSMFSGIRILVPASVN